MNKEPIILAIESSCDDTAAAVALGTKILSNNIANQKIHEKFGGVVPELASRAHQQNIIPEIGVCINQPDVVMALIVDHRFSRIIFRKS